MLYNVELLKKDGRFGVLWYLGNANPSSTNVPKKLKRKLVDRVVVRRMCSEVADLLPVSSFIIFLSGFPITSDWEVRIMANFTGFSCTSI
jgi:hypothetical protein